ncbi:MAG: PIN domain-containing protein [Candidatus Binatia bacterium]
MAVRNLFVLDTSALLTLRGNEAGADRVAKLLQQATRRQCRLLVSFMTRMETLYLIWRDEGEQQAREALRLLDSLAIEWVSCEPRILEASAYVKSQGGLSVADSWIAATAISREATLIHKDPEFQKFKELAQEFLAR